MNESRPRTVVVSVSLPAHLRDRARRAACDDRRSLSSLVAGLLREHLQREGYLAEQTTLPLRPRS